MRNNQTKRDYALEDKARKLFPCSVFYFERYVQRIGPLPVSDRNKVLREYPEAVLERKNVGLPSEVYFVFDGPYRTGFERKLLGHGESNVLAWKDAKKKMSKKQSA